MGKRQNFILKIRNWIGNQIIYKIFYFFGEKNSIFEESWKYLIILDACRYDYFKKAIKKVNLKGKLKLKKSVACITGEWFEKTFKKNYYPNIIYINSNPHISKFPNKFFKRIDLWKKEWNNRFNTVLPKTVCFYALKYALTYPNKRVIAHFLQPHFPYLDDPNLGKDAIDFARGVIKNPKKISSKSFFTIADWHFYVENVNRIKNLYEKNLLYALREVKKLINNLKNFGKIVITSDHGEAFGERFLFFKVYGHKRVRIPAITYIPWFEVRK